MPSADEVAPTKRDKRRPAGNYNGRNASISSGVVVSATTCLRKSRVAQYVGTSHDARCCERFLKYPSNGIGRTLALDK